MGSPSDGVAIFPSRDMVRRTAKVRHGSLGGIVSIV
jgi:hypothetical protein